MSHPRLLKTGGEPFHGRFPNAVRGLAKMVRLRTFLLFFLAAPIGSLVASSMILFEGVMSMMFAGFTIMFGLVLNDVEDAELDKLAGKNRNPIATRELSKREGFFIALIFLSLSLSMIPFLNLYNQILGLVVIILSYTYSSGIRAKSKPLIDVIYHGLCLAIFAAVGYIQQKPFDVRCLLLSTVIFFLSGVSQIFQQIRDWESDQKMRATTVIRLGKRKSLILCLIFFSIVFTLFALAPFYGIVPFEYLLLSPLTYFVVSPIVKTIRDVEYEKEMIKLINNRAPILILILIVTYFLLK